MAIDRDMKVLIVDDQDAMRLLIKQALHNLGFRNLLQASDGSAALKVFQREPDIALVFSDLRMEPMTGLHLLSAVRADYGSVPFIMVTASTDTSDILEAKEKGVDHYLAKPFNIKSIQNRIEAVFKDKL